MVLARFVTLRLSYVLELSAAVSVGGALPLQLRNKFLCCDLM